jgi:hypothetical protein
MLLALPASAKEPHAFDSQHFSSHDAQREYFNSLTNSNKNEAQPERPAGGLCCSFADGKRLEDPDWTAGNEFKGEKSVGTRSSRRAADCDIAKSIRLPRRLEPGITRLPNI